MQRVKNLTNEDIGPNKSLKIIGKFTKISRPIKSCGLKINGNIFRVNGVYVSPYTCPEHLHKYYATKVGGWRQLRA